MDGEEQNLAMKSSPYCRSPFLQLWAWGSCRNLSLVPPKPRSGWKQGAVVFPFTTLLPSCARLSSCIPLGRSQLSGSKHWGLPHGSPTDAAALCPADHQRLCWEGRAHQHIQCHCGNPLDFHHYPCYQGKSSSKGLMQVAGI